MSDDSYDGVPLFEASALPLGGTYSNTLSKPSSAEAMRESMRRLQEDLDKPAGHVRQPVLSSEGTGHDRRGRKHRLEQVAVSACHTINPDADPFEECQRIKIGERVIDATETTMLCEYYCCQCGAVLHTAQRMNFAWLTKLPKTREARS